MQALFFSLVATGVGFQAADHCPYLHSSGNQNDEGTSSVNSWCLLVQEGTLFSCLEFEYPGYLSPLICSSACPFYLLLLRFSVTGFDFSFKANDCKTLMSSSRAGTHPFLWQRVYVCLRACVCMCVEGGCVLKVEDFTACMEALVMTPRCFWESSILPPIHGSAMQDELSPRSLPRASDWALYIKHRQYFQDT